MTSLLRPPTEPPTEAVRFPEWVNRNPSSFFDTCGLGHRLGWSLLILENRCRARCFCWVGNEELAKNFGMAERATRNVLSELEAAGWILRIEPPPGHPGRVGILLLKRANPDLPVAAREEVAEIILRLNLAKSGVAGRKLRVSPAENCRRVAGRKLPANKEEAGNKDESSKDESKSSSSLNCKVHTVPGDDDDVAALPGERETADVPEPAEVPGPAVPVAEPTPSPAVVDAVLEVVGLIRTLFGDDPAGRVEAGAARIGRQIRGRWDCYRAAVWVTSDVKRRPEKLLPYLMAAARKNIEFGIDPEAARIEAMHRAKAKAALDAAVAAAAARQRRRAPPEEEVPLSPEESRAHWTGLLKSTNRSLRELAEKNLAKLGIDPSASA